MLCLVARSLRRAGSCVVVAVGVLSCAHSPSPTTDAEAWRRDLEVLADTLRARHPKLLHPDLRYAFDKDVADIERRIARLDRPHRIAERARLVATLHDGTRSWDSLGTMRSAFAVCPFASTCSATACMSCVPTPCMPIYSAAVSSPLAPSRSTAPLRDCARGSTATMNQRAGTSWPHDWCSRSCWQSRASARALIPPCSTSAGPTAPR